MKVIGISSGGLKGKLVNYNKIVYFTQLGKLLTIMKSGRLLKIIGQNKYEKKQRAARDYVQKTKGMIDDDINTGDMEEAFIAGVDWQN